MVGKFSSTPLRFYSSKRVRIAALSILVLIPVLTATVDAQPVYPTVTVTIHRIQVIDSVEGPLEGQADWFYHIGYRSQGDSAFTWTDSISAPSGSDDVILNSEFDFQVPSDSVEIIIELCDSDAASGDDLADVSSDSFEGVDNVDCSVRPPTGMRYGGSFFGSYDLATGMLSGDDTTVELGWLKTSGEFDGSASGDTNDANIFFGVEDNYQLPMANAGVDRSGFSGDTFSFSGLASVASTGSSIELFNWDFTGDLAPDAVGSIASWTFNSKGTHVITLTVQDSTGNIDSDAATVTIRNRVPTAAFGYGPTNPTVRDGVEFADTSTDDDGTIASWFWSFGDGATSTVPNPTHRYTTNGPKSVTLAVTDNDGASASIVRTVIVVNLGPAASFAYAPSSVTTADVVQFTDASTDEDGTVATWSWDFGDGSTSTSKNPTHNFASAETYTVTLVVTDDDGVTNSASRAVNVVLGVQTTPALPLNILPYVVLAVVVIIAAAAALVLSRRGRILGNTPSQVSP